MSKGPIAHWLRGARALQHDEPGDDGWTQPRVIDEMRLAIGWAPSRPNLSAYETGRSTPNRDTLAKFRDFWARYPNVPPLDLTPAAPAPTDQEALTAALLAQTAALEEYTAGVNALVSRIDQLLPSDRVREMLAWAAENMPASSRSPLPTPDRAGSPGAR